MHLKSISLGGFKSFAEPAQVLLPFEFSAIVGPNGCGKSNIVDAVRWVTGELSARHLRSGTMSEVIFNGTDKRKPLSRAFVELIFDNSEGRLGGEYARFAEISVRRELDTDGISIYQLNGSRCRRRDIVDLFLGTGLGPESYAIIEQGRVSQLVEYKPDELRLLVEEAAGVSRYRERRRETANRVRHTRENLQRLEDLQAELGTRLKELKVQADAAAIHRRHRERRELLQAQLLALAYRDCDEREKELTAEYAEQTNRIEKLTLELRQAENRDEDLQGELDRASEQFNQVQTDFFAGKAEVARIEETLAQRKQRGGELVTEVRELNERLQELSGLQRSAAKQLEQWQGEQQELQPLLESAREQFEREQTELQRCEELQQQFQQRWDEWREQLLKLQHSQEQHLADRQNLQLAESRLRNQLSELESELGGEGSEAGDDTELAAEAEAAALKRRQVESELNELKTSIAVLADRREQAVQKNNQALEQWVQLRERYAASIVGDSAEQQQWLQTQGMDKNARPAEDLSISEGWETAVMLVLGDFAGAVSLEDLHRFIDSLSTAPPAVFSAVAESTQPPPTASSESLASKVEGHPQLTALLAEVLAVETDAEALEYREKMAPGQSVISRSGLWLGNGWLKLAGAAGEQSTLKEQRAAVQNAEHSCREAEQALKTAEQALEAERRRSDEFNAELLAVVSRDSELQSLLARKREGLTRRKRAEESRGQTVEELQQIDTRLRELTQQADDTERDLSALQEQREEMTAQRDSLHQKVGDCRSAHHQSGLALREQEQSIYTLKVRIEEIQKSIALQRTQIEHSEKSLAELTTQQQKTTEPVAQLEHKLFEYMESGRKLEAQLTEIGDERAKISEARSKIQQQRHATEAGIASMRDRENELSSQLGAAGAEKKSIEERLAELNRPLPELLAQLPEDIEVDKWQARIARVDQRVQELGPVNPAATADYQQAQERFSYIQSQYEEVNQTLDKLTGAIQSIDTASRKLFRETLERINQNLGTYIERLFGSGNARLVMTEDDPLRAGVELLVRLPGKRHSNIQQLSGGEKALAAIALVFAIFQLNPAPFCLLDEVDAPLDDLNTRRLVTLVREMASQVQIICVTHNKITMEESDNLLGVTMAEPGVSRVVGVDLARAEELAKQSITAA